MMNVENITILRKNLIDWGINNFRPFPWRTTKNPYRMLMAEVMLHRTQAVQVLRTYNDFIECYPNIGSLAEVSKIELYDLLYSLGLRWRVDYIYDMVQKITNEFGNCIPENKTELQSLPGISDYIASSVRCFAWNLPEPLVDTNTVRIVGRLFGLTIKDSSRRNPIFRELIAMILDKNNPRQFNYALLDLADSICTRKIQPKCIECPITTFCRFRCNQNESNIKEYLVLT